MSRTIVSVRDSKNVPFVYAKKDPATGLYYTNSDITSVSAQIIKPDGTTITPTNPITFVYTTAAGGFKGYIANWNAASDLDSLPWVTAVITPVRSGIPAALASPKEVELDLSDLAKRQDEIEATVVAGDSQTQSAISQIGAAANAQLLGPKDFRIPDSGSSVFVLDFVLKDLDGIPVALVDPTSNIVDVSVVDQTGSMPTGISLAGAPAGRMTRASQGVYSLVVTVTSTAVDASQLRFTAAFVKGGVSNIALWTTVLGDFDQLDTIETQVTAIRSTDVPAIQANITSQTNAILTLLNNATYGLVALQAILVVVRDRIGLGADVAGVDTVRGQIRTIIDTYLASSTYGLAALNVDLDALLSRMGITTDAGGSSTAGSAMAKLNAILVFVADHPSEPDIQEGGSFPPQP